MGKYTYCAALCCRNNSRNNPSLAFFSLPKEVDRRRKWLTIIKREDLLQKEPLRKGCYLVCSAHFEESSFKIVQHLKKDALPSLNIQHEHQLNLSCSKDQPSSARVKKKEIRLSKSNEIIKGNSWSSNILEVQSTTDIEDKSILYLSNKERATQTESSREIKQTETSKSLTRRTQRKSTNDQRKFKIRQLDQKIKKAVKALDAKIIMLHANQKI